METWQMTPSTFSALTVCNIYFYIWIHFHLNSKFIFMWSPYGLFWSVKYLNFGQKLPIWTAHHAFLESRYPKATKNPYYVSSLKGSQKTVSAHGLIPTGRAVYIRYFKINPPISVVLSFLKIISTLKDTPSHICMDSQGVYLPRIFLEFFPKPVYSTAEKFQIYSVKLLVWQKLESVHFSSCPQIKTLPQIFIIIPVADGNCPFHLNSLFWRYFFLSRKGGERIMEVKKLTRVLVTRFDKFHHLCNLYIFGLFCCAII